MTRDSDFKKKVRARMAKTGERYSAARAKLLATAPPAQRPIFGGVHTDTAALRAMLAGAGVVDPSTGEPFDEAMLLGLGGGIGAAYYVFEYAGSLPNLYIETRVGPQYPYTAGLFSRVAGNLGLAVDISESGGARKAAANLDRALESGQPALVWCDMAGLPHHHLGDQMGGALPHVVLVAAIEGDVTTVYDRSAEPFTIDRATLEAARNRLRKAKNRVLSIAPGPVADRDRLVSAIGDGLRRCVENLDGTADAPGYAANMGLGALEKWADLVNSDVKKGWPRVFRRGPALNMGLREAYYWIEAAGTGGGGFRFMYADFLDQAARVLDRGVLARAADRYRSLAGQWTALARRMLPDAGALGTARGLIDSIEAALIDGPGATDEIPATRARLEALTRDGECPLDEAEVAELYADLEARLRELVAGEREARDLLASAH